MNDPIDNIIWRNASELKPNLYNPNVVFNQELKLLALSIVQNGWIQPVLVNKNDTIIDGFHRWRLSLEDKGLIEKYQGKVPTAVLDISDEDAMLLTVRINRAKGAHIAMDMSKLVKQLVEAGVPKEKIVKEIGGTMAEINLLLQEGVFTEKNIKDYKYSKAWIPKETKPQKDDV